MKERPKTGEKNKLLNELISKQIKDSNLYPKKKLQYNDLKRICKYINGSIFDENKCCIWNGYITNENKPNKGTYINFYFNRKKIAIHRLLYINFVGNLNNDEYLKFSCENKGKCCNVTHLKKFKFYKEEENDKKIIKKAKKSKIIKITREKSLTLNFD